MVSSARQCPGVEGKVCDRVLPSMENDPHRLCVSCLGKSCKIDDCCEEYHDWSDDCCTRVSDYIHKLSWQRETRRERKDKASSSSFSGFSPLMPVRLCQRPSSAGAGVVTTTPSTACAVTFSTATPVVSAAPFVLPVDVSPVEPGRKQDRVDSPGERAKILAAFKDIWPYSWSLSPLLGLLSAPQPSLVSAPVPPPAVLAPVPPVVPIEVSIAPAATSSTHSDSSSCSAASSSHSRKQLRSRPSPGSRLSPVRSPSVPAPASLGSRSQSCHPSGSQPHLLPV